MDKDTNMLFEAYSSINEGIKKGIKGAALGGTLGAAGGALIGGVKGAAAGAAKGASLTSWLPQVGPVAGVTAGLAAGGGVAGGIAGAKKGAAIGGAGGAALGGAAGALSDDEDEERPEFVTQVLKGLDSGRYYAVFGITPDGENKGKMYAAIREDDKYTDGDRWFYETNYYIKHEGSDKMQSLKDAEGQELMKATYNQFANFNKHIDPRVFKD